jgi:hypothetical protein
MQCAGACVRALQDTRERVTEYVQSWIPPRVLRVSYLPEGGDAFVPLYDGRAVGWRWHAAFMQTMFAPQGAHYLLETWHTERKGRNYHLLSAETLSEALQLRGLTSWWAMTDFGICTLLSAFFAARRPNTRDLFAIMVNGEDATTVLKPFLSSIALPQNVTAAALTHLYHHITGRGANKKHDGDTRVTLVDRELEERVIEGDECITVSPR